MEWSNTIPSGRSRRKEQADPAGGTNLVGRELAKCCGELNAPVGLGAAPRGMLRPARQEWRGDANVSGLACGHQDRSDDLRRRANVGDAQVAGELSRGGV